MWHWCVTEPNRCLYSRFWTSNRFTSFERFSKCFFFLQRDRRADSLFDIIRFRFRSSVEQTAGLVSSEPDCEATWWSVWKRDRSFWISVSSRTGNWKSSIFPEIELAEKKKWGWAERERGGGKKEGEREGRNCRDGVFMDKWGRQVGSGAGVFWSRRVLIVLDMLGKLYLCMVAAGGGVAFSSSFCFYLFSCFFKNNLLLVREGVWGQQGISLITKNQTKMHKTTEESRVWAAQVTWEVGESLVEPMEWNHASVHSRLPRETKERALNGYCWFTIRSIPAKQRSKMTNHVLWKWFLSGHSANSRKWNFMTQHFLHFAFKKYFIFLI